MKKPENLSISQLSQNNNIKTRGRECRTSTDMTNELNEFLYVVQRIYMEIWDYGHSKKNYPLHCKKSEGLTEIKLEIYSKDHDYLTGYEIEKCIEIANRHQETCFKAWHVATTTILVDTKQGHLVSVLTPTLVISIYQKSKEETEE